ncbi:cation:proton antiporter [Limnovirga soli]|uniref:Sodium:proton antiporter n=1 Tax=Limnovirga soli TaxID=2656915 RepID=A0A8J8FD09_9BACT|nr:sodium:proton antiporter [Limnovirga soli]NNV55815.1 sodium:proton antiporter [Limnovirga soli]
MDLFYIITFLICISAIFAYLNVRFLKLPSTIGLMLIAIIFSLCLFVVGFISPAIFNHIKKAVDLVDFSTVVLDVMLCFLLFAGAMHTNFDALKENRKSILLFAVISTLLSTFFMAGILYGVCILLQFPVAFIYCLLFGALVSPTDPIAVLGILTKANVPEKAEINIVGESLFNDGIGVVLFLTLLSIYNNGIENTSAADIGVLLLEEVGGGLVLGLVLGAAIYYLLKSIDHYETELLITLAIVMGGYVLADSIHVSGPLAVVVAGLMTGHHSKNEAMSDRTKDNIDQFWHLLDVLMNALLFVMIGLRVLTLEFKAVYFWIALFIIPAVVIARYISLQMPFQLFKRRINIDNKTLLIMTWGGLRGGLSIAMALSLANEAPKEMLVFITYGVVLFSIVVQGLTVGKVARRIYSK